MVQPKDFYCPECGKHVDHGVAVKIRDSTHTVLVCSCGYAFGLKKWNTLKSDDGKERWYCEGELSIN